MMKSNAVAIFIFALAVDVSVCAFVSKHLPLSRYNPKGRSTQAILVIEVAPELDKYSESFNAYITKSHEEKLKAIKDAENRKNIEIKALKEELAEITKGTTRTATNIESSEGSIEEMSAKLLAYQKFMSDYIVKSHEEKYNAVKAAEEAISKKYKSKLDVLMLNPVDATSMKVSSQTDHISIESYDKRCANVASAGKAGKSRWSAAEVERISSQTDRASIDSYDKRSATVVAAGKAGKSRWSNAEVERVSSSK